jgi:hypothetical protein
VLGDVEDETAVDAGPEVDGRGEVEVVVEPPVPPEQAPL